MALPPSLGWVPAMPLESAQWLDVLGFEGGAASARQLAPPLLLLLTTALLLRILCLACSGSAGAVGGGAGSCEGATVCREVEASGARGGMPCKPHVQWTFLPSTGVCFSNADGPEPFDNEHASGRFLFLHRPTFDPDLDVSGSYPYASHFAQRRRLWEMRVQMRVKRGVQDTLYFGTHADCFVPRSVSLDTLRRLILSLFRGIAGNVFYESPGDDPATTPAPHELPGMSMPPWGCDQFIETPAGQTPPSLTDPNMATLGQSRTQDRARFCRDMAELRLEPGFTYTFNVWGISRLIDLVKWELQGIVPRWPVDISRLCCRPPLHLALYTLAPGAPDTQGQEERRHLESRKRYLLHVAFWSSLKPPPLDCLDKLLHVPDERTPDATVHERSETRLSVKRLRHRGLAYLCCS